MDREIHTQFYDNSTYKYDLEQAFNNTPNIEALKNKTIVITGARGMIGSFLTELLIYCNREKNYQCQIYAAGRDIRKIADRFGPNSKEPWFHPLVFCLETPVYWDINADYVIHAAGNAHPGAFMSDPTGTLWGSVNGAYQLLRFASAQKDCRFLMISSGEVYGLGTSDMAAFDEDYTGIVDILNPRSCYPMGKRMCENLCSCFISQYGLNIGIVRSCHVYGPTFTSEDNRIAVTCIRSALKQKDIKLNSDGAQMRSYCYIADCASGIMTVLLNGTPGQVYNVSPGEPGTTIKEFAEKTAAIAGCNVSSGIAGDRERKAFNPMESSVLSAERIKKLGWQTVYSLDMGIKHSLIILQELYNEPERDFEGKR